MLLHLIYAFTFLTLDYAFSLKNSPYLFELRTDVASRESYLSVSYDIRKLRTPLLEEHNGPVEAKTALEQSNFVNNILTSMKRRVRMFVLSCHDQESEAGSVKHLLQPGCNCDPCGGLPIKLFPG